MLPFFFAWPHGVDRHDPKDGDAEILEVIEPMLDAAKVAAGGEGARVDPVDDGMTADLIQSRTACTPGCSAKERSSREK
jgi:hypothetical protein